MLLRIIHIAIFLLELRGLHLAFSEGGWKIFVYYTQISNLLSLISSAALVIFGDTVLIACIRYLACCMLVFTFFVCACALTPMGGDPKYLFLTGHCVYHHLICPVASTLVYVFLERHAGFAMVPIATGVTLFYGLLMVFLNAAGKVDGPYPFFRVHDQSKLATAAWMAVLFLAAGALFSLLWWAAGQ